MSLRELSVLTEVDASHIARIEKGVVQGSLTTLTALATALGADMSVRFFAGTGPRIHDRLQAPMLESFVRSLAPCWLARLEVVVPAAKRGVADIVLADRTRPQLVVGEAQSQFRRIEQQLRWIAEKAKAFAESEADRNVSRLLIVKSTAATRQMARDYAATLSAAYPARTAEVVDSLTRGMPWPGDGMVWMRLERGIAELLPYPPRGVPVGR